MEKYELTIIGGGPAAIAAGVYAARKQLRTLIVAKEFGGQSIVSETIYNWIGTKEVSGTDLATSLREHLESYKGEYLDIVEAEATKISGTTGDFTVATSDGSYSTQTVIVASGAGRRKLSVPGADTFEHKGLTYCASCDGPLFSGADVAVIGGGNAGFETAAQLLAYVKSVTLLDVGSTFRADPITIDKVTANPNMNALTNAETLEVTGDTMVSGLRYKDTETGDEHTLAVTGIFVEIGIVPNTFLVDGLVEFDEAKRIKVDPRTQRASLEGIWAAGDCTDGLYEQNNIAVGDAVKALEDVYLYLKTG